MTIKIFSPTLFFKLLISSSSTSIQLMKTHQHESIIETRMHIFAMALADPFEVNHSKLSNMMVCNNIYESSMKSNYINKILTPLTSTTKPKA